MDRQGVRSSKFAIVAEQVGTGELLVDLTVTTCGPNGDADFNLGIYNQ